MGIKIEFNVLISDKLREEIRLQIQSLGIKNFEYSSMNGGSIEFNDNVTQAQVDQRMEQLKNRLVRRIP